MKWYLYPLLLFGFRFVLLVEPATKYVLTPLSIRSIRRIEDVYAYWDGGMWIPLPVRWMAESPKALVETLYNRGQSMELSMELQPFWVPLQKDVRAWCLMQKD